MLKSSKAYLLVALLILFIPESRSISLDVFGGDENGISSSRASLGAAEDSYVNIAVLAAGSSLQPKASISGTIPDFEQSHQVTDKAGKHAEVYAYVHNGIGIKYAMQVMPYEGTVAGFIPYTVSADEWLSVDSADIIKCSSKAVYGSSSAEQSTEITKGYISGYHNQAYASDDGSVSASQDSSGACPYSAFVKGSAIKVTSRSSQGVKSADACLEIGSGEISGLSATSNGRQVNARISNLVASGNKIAASSDQSDGTGTYALKTSLSGTSTMPARLSGNIIASGLSASQEISMASGSAITIEDRRIKGGNAQDVVLKRSTPLMYTTMKSYDSGKIINDLISLASSGDVINVAAGLYKENIRIDKSITLNGAGKGSTIIDGGNKGSTLKVARGSNAVISGMTVQGGSGTATWTSWLKGTYNCGGGIWNEGVLTVTGCGISGNRASYGGGVFNMGSTKIAGSDISQNSAVVSGGGILNAPGASLDCNPPGQVHDNTPDQIKYY